MGGVWRRVIAKTLHKESPLRWPGLQPQRAWLHAQIESSNHTFAIKNAFKRQEIESSFFQRGNSSFFFSHLVCSEMAEEWLKPAVPRPSQNEPPDVPESN